MKQILRMKYIRTILTLCVLLTGVGVASAQQRPLNCGKYKLVQDQSGSHCQRTGFVPWYVGVPGTWETEILFGNTGTNSITFWYGEYHEDNLSLSDRIRGEFVAESVGNTLASRASYRVRIKNKTSSCSATCDASGSIWVEVDGPDEASIDAATASYIYRYFGGTPSVLSQTVLPVIFEDQASSRWSAAILETPKNVSSNSAPNVTAIAVRSYSDQNVIVTVYDTMGHRVASTSIPSTASWSGIGGFLLSELLNVNLPVNSGSDFRGTVVFEGQLGDKIAPILLQATGTSVMAVPVNPE